MKKSVDLKQKLDAEILRVEHQLKKLRSCRATLQRLDAEADALLANTPSQTLTAKVTALFEGNRTISTSEVIRLTNGKPTSVSAILSRLRKQAQ
jgi:uncharacterized iron-regulated protein